MAKECAFCGKQIGVFAQSIPVIDDSGAELCAMCAAYQTALKSAIDATSQERIDKAIRKIKMCCDMPIQAMKHVDAILGKYADKVAKAKKDAEEEEEISRKAKEVKQQQEARKKEILNMLLTTCPSVEGYSITKQCGLVFGEVIFKSGFLKSLSASVDNLSDVFSAGDRELSGSARQLNDARNYAINKMKAEAGYKGANAIIGIDAETSFGGDFIHVTIMGTAVYIEKNDTNAATITGDEI